MSSCLMFFQDHDGADDLINAERAHLLNCKKALEAQLKSVQQQLHVSAQVHNLDKLELNCLQNNLK